MWLFWWPLQSVRANQALRYSYAAICPSRAGELHAKHERGTFFDSWTRQRKGLGAAAGDCFSHYSRPAGRRMRASAAPDALALPNVVRSRLFDPVLIEVSVEGDCPSQS